MLNGLGNAWILSLLLSGLTFIIVTLMGIVGTLLGLAVRMHIKSDDERWQRINAEIDSLRKRLHDYAGIIGRLDQAERFRESDGD